MAAKRLAAALVILLMPLAAAGQWGGNVLHVSQFPGLTVGQKLTAAQAACSPNIQIPCILVLDPVLSIFPQGSLPAACSNCYWQDYRNGIPGGAGTGACTNQAVTAINSGAPTCSTITSAFVDNSIAKTGTDINTAGQVTALHLGGFTPAALGAPFTVYAGTATGTLAPAPVTSAFCSQSAGAACAASTIATVGATDQLFIIWTYIIQTSNGSGGTCSTGGNASSKFNFTDADTGSVKTAQQLTALTVNTAGVGSYVNTGIVIRAQAGSAIQMLTTSTATNCTTQPTYKVYDVLQAL